MPDVPQHVDVHRCARRQSRENGAAYMKRPRGCGPEPRVRTEVVAVLRLGRLDPALRGRDEPEAGVVRRVAEQGHQRLAVLLGAGQDLAHQGSTDPLALTVGEDAQRAESRARVRRPRSRGCTRRARRRARPHAATSESCGSQPSSSRSHSSRVTSPGGPPSWTGGAECAALANAAPTTSPVADVGRLLGPDPDRRGGVVGGWSRRARGRGVETAGDRDALPPDSTGGALAERWLPAFLEGRRADDDVYADGVSTWHNIGEREAEIQRTPSRTRQVEGGADLRVEDARLRVFDGGWVVQATAVGTNADGEPGPHPDLPGRHAA